jgi:hypothetical protein
LVLADKAYINRAIAAELAEYNRVKLLTLPKSHQKKRVSRAQQRLHNHFRQIVETVNGQLEEQFAIEENYAHGFSDLGSRLITKLTGHTLSIYLNRLLQKAGFLHIKELAFPEVI